MKIILVLLLAFISSYSNAESSRCESAREFKKLIMDRSYSELPKLIHFPVQALIGGSQVTISDGVMLKALSKSIFTENFIASIKEVDDCELAVKLDIGEDDKVASLSIIQQKSDLRYSKSGITSEKQLDKFMESVNNYISTENYSSLSELFRYPFFIFVNGHKLKVETKKEFLKYESDIVNASFLALISRISRMKNYIPRMNGLMLNSKGDYWIIEVHGRLYLQPVEPFYK